MVVPPGWNVTEPLHIAKKVYDFVQLYRSASDEARAFASKIELFCQALESLEDCLKNVDVSEEEELKKFAATLEGCRACAGHCLKFVEQFQKQNDESEEKRLTAGGKVVWVWKKETSSRLKQEIDSQIQGINLLLHLASWRREQKARPTAPSAPLSIGNRLGVHEGSPQLEPRQLSLTPADLLRHPTWDRPSTSRSLGTSPPTLSMVPSNSEAISPLQALPPPRSDTNLTARSQATVMSTASSVFSRPAIPPTRTDTNLTAYTEAQVCPSDASVFSQISQQSSWTDYLSPEILPRRDSTLSLCPPTADMTMDDLVGAKISYHKTDPDKTLPIKKIEFMKEADGTLRYIIVTPPAGYSAKFHHRISTSPRSIPHTEHPRAYGNQKVLLAKFLEPQLFKSQRWSASSSASSMPSPSIAPARNSMSPVSPVLSEMGVKIKEETEFPKYHFEDEDDYKKFQGNVMGKEMSVNVPIELIKCKRINDSRLRTECERQYLRLWDDGYHQTLMFFANNVGQYVEYELQYFRVDYSKSSTYSLKLDVIFPKSFAPKATKRGSWLKGSSKSIAIPDAKQKGRAMTFSEEDSLEELKSIESLTITFTEADGKTDFEDKAIFNGAASSARPHPPPFQQSIVFELPDSQPSMPELAASNETPRFELAGRMGY